MKNSIGRSEVRNFWIFVMPWIIGFICFTIIPIAVSAILSFTTAKASTLTTRPLKFVGFMNFFDIFTTDHLFLRSIGNTFIYAICKVALGMVASLSLAVLLNCKFRGRKLFRVLIYLPAVIPAVSSALIWSLLIFQDRSYLVNVLQVLGFGKINFALPQYAMITVIVINTFGMAGPWMVVLLAALQGVPEDIIEAAHIEGANAWVRFIRIVIPMISPTLFFLVVTGFINSLQTYAEIALLIKNNENTYTMTMSVMDNAFGGYGMGYACAEAWIVFVIIMIFTVLFFKLGGKKVYYAGD